MTAAARPPRLHVVTDATVLARADFRVAALAVLRAVGPRVALHLRGREVSGRALLELAVALSRAAEAVGGRVLVNERVDVAMVAATAGVHLGARSLPVAVARRLVGPDRWVGVSVHAAAEMEPAKLEGADFAFMGTIYPSATHHGLPGVGSAGLRDAVAAAGAMPVLGIGGIGVDQVSDVMRTGAWGVAVIRGVWSSPDPAEAVAEYLERIETFTRTEVGVG